MNKKQKMIQSIYKNHCLSCKVQGLNPLCDYKTFRNIYLNEPFNSVLEVKNWYKVVGKYYRTIWEEITCQ